MEVIVLGCGTSTGVPIVGCHCAVCRSQNPRNHRFRSSVAVQLPQGQVILIDTTPDLRQQALTNRLERVDAVFYTHCHADHIHGIDEIRSYNFLQKEPVSVYGVEEHLAHLKKVFPYIFEKTIQVGGGKPNIETKTVELFKPFELFGVTITPLQMWHGKLLTVGWRIGNFAYLTDVNCLPDESRSYLDGLDLLIIGALRYRKHPTHFTVEEATDLALSVSPKRCYLTHMCHEIEYNEASCKLPSPIHPAYDTLRIAI